MMTAHEQGIGKMDSKKTVRLKVNGTPYEREIEPRLLLSDFLRHELSLTGTHVGCEHGVCGACTVLLEGEPVRSCLTFAVQVEGRGDSDRGVPGDGRGHGAAGGFHGQR